MRVGKFIVRRKRNIAQTIIDILSFALFSLTVLDVYALFIFDKSGNNSRFSVLIYPFFAVGIIVVSIFLTYKDKPLPKKLVITHDNAQEYHKLIVASITGVRFLLLHLIYGLCNLHCGILLDTPSNGIGVMIADVVVIALLVSLSLKRAKRYFSTPKSKVDKLIEY